MSKDIRLRLGEHIRSLRAKHDLTQEELARRAAISTNYLQNLESRNPKTASVLTLEKLAKGFGVPVWQMLRF
ncbi:helix-turn-helix transcriptional regulator [Candidatus Peribacteria bacterium]|nr:helix-turn-helix transcriptional regulator [Candidatus Peribacteria bacterium]